MFLHTMIETHPRAHFSWLISAKSYRLVSKVSPVSKSSTILVAVKIENSGSSMNIIQLQRIITAIGKISCIKYHLIINSHNQYRHSGHLLSRLLYYMQPSKTS